MTTGLCMISVTDCTFANGKSRSFVETEFCVLLSGTVNCSPKNGTAEPATGNNDDLSVNSASGNKTSVGGRMIRAASDETRSDLSAVTCLCFGM